MPANYQDEMISCCYNERRDAEGFGPKVLGTGGSFSLTSALRLAI